MKNRKIIIGAAVIGLVLLTASIFFFSQPAKTQAANPCKKNFYTNSDIVGYFRDIEKDDSYYITNDWCVVKSVLWWGSIFATYLVDESELKSRITYIYPEPQIYFGLLPEYFLKANKDNQPRKGAFCTVGLKQYGYLSNDDPFRNIYGNNYPQPPKFVDDEKICNDGNKSNQIIKPPTGSMAAIIMQRMHDLHYTIFEPRIAKGQCKNLSLYKDLITACNYFAKRVQTYIPPAYKAFSKDPGLIQ